MLNYPFQHLMNTNDWYFVFSYLEFKTNIITLTKSVSAYDTDNELISQSFGIKKQTPSLDIWCSVTLSRHGHCGLVGQGQGSYKEKWNTELQLRPRCCLRSKGKHCKGFMRISDYQKRNACTSLSHQYVQLPLQRICFFMIRVADQKAVLFSSSYETFVKPFTVWCLFPLCKTLR